MWKFASASGGMHREAITAVNALKTLRVAALALQYVKSSSRNTAKANVAERRQINTRHIANGVHFHSSHVHSIRNECSVISLAAATFPACVLVFSVHIEHHVVTKVDITLAPLCYQFKRHQLWQPTPAAEAGLTKSFNASDPWRPRLSLRSLRPQKDSCAST